MNTNDDNQAQQIYESLKEAVKDGLLHIKKLQDQKKYIGTYLNFPELKWFDSGLPQITQGSIFGGPIDYKSAFEKDFAESTASWKAFQDLASATPQLNRYYLIREGKVDDFHTSYMIFTIKALIDRYIHISKQTDFDETTFRNIYVEWETGAFSDTLSFDIIVPLIYVTFESESLFFNKELGICKINDEIQVARIMRKSLDSSPYECVTGAATHGIILRGWHIENRAWLHREMVLSDPDAFSKAIQLINQFFAALRSVTGFETGYNQLVVYPLGWGDNWNAHLPDISVVPVKAYPDHFNKGGWTEKPPIITNSQLAEAYRVYDTITTSGSNKLQLACNRLNEAYLRRTEDDAIIDITIGLEALLAYDSKAEITYRLAMRLAGLSKLEKFENYSPTDIFDICKRIYDYRSAVVHGSHDVVKKRVVSSEENAKPVPAVRLGLSLLRYTIRVLSHHKNYLDTKELDYFILQT